MTGNFWRHLACVYSVEEDLFVTGQGDWIDHPEMANCFDFLDHKRNMSVYDAIEKATGKSFYDCFHDFIVVTFCNDDDSLDMDRPLWSGQDHKYGCDAIDDLDERIKKFRLTMMENLRREWLYTSSTKNSGFYFKNDTCSNTIVYNV